MKCSLDMPWFAGRQTPHVWNDGHESNTTTARIRTGDPNPRRPPRHARTHGPWTLGGWPRRAARVGPTGLARARPEPRVARLDALQARQGRAQDRRARPLGRRVGRDLYALPHRRRWLRARLRRRRLLRLPGRARALRRRGRAGARRHTVRPHRRRHVRRDQRHGAASPTRRSTPSPSPTDSTSAYTTSSRRSGEIPDST